VTTLPRVEAVASSHEDGSFRGVGATCEAGGDRDVAGHVLPEQASCNVSDLCLREEVVLES